MISDLLHGAYRKPVELNWLIGIVLFTAGHAEGLFGYSSRTTAVRRGLASSKRCCWDPDRRTSCRSFLFGGQFPGTEIIPRCTSSTCC